MSCVRDPDFPPQASGNEPFGRALNALPPHRRHALGLHALLGDAPRRPPLDPSPLPLIGYLHAQQRSGSELFGAKALAVFNILALRLGASAAEFVRAIAAHTEVAAVAAAHAAALASSSSSSSSSSSLLLPSSTAKQHVLSRKRLVQLGSACSREDLKPILDLWVAAADVPAFAVTAYYHRKAPENTVEFVLEGSRRRIDGKIKLLVEEEDKGAFFYEVTAGAESDGRAQRFACHSYVRKMRKHGVSADEDGHRHVYGDDEPVQKRPYHNDTAVRWCAVDPDMS